VTPFKKPHTGPCTCGVCDAYVLAKAHEAVREAYNEMPGASDEEIERRASALLAEARTKVVLCESVTSQGDPS